VSVVTSRRDPYFESFTIPTISTSAGWSAPQLEASAHGIHTWKESARDRFIHDGNRRRVLRVSLIEVTAGSSGVRNVVKYSGVTKLK
jgi:hypothetical protein